MSGCLYSSPLCGQHFLRRLLNTRSWLAATYDGVDHDLLAFLKEGSMFKFNGKCFAVIELYPRAKDVEFDTISTAVPSSLGS